MSGYKVKYTIGISIYSMFCALVVLMQSSGLLVLKIENASVFLALLLAVYAGYYFGEYGAAVIGLLMGAATDVYSSTYCFNTLMLTVIGFVSGILIRIPMKPTMACALSTTEAFHIRSRGTSDTSISWSKGKIFLQIL